MLLARLIHFYHPAHSILRIPASVLSSIFVLLDIVSFVIQIVGGSYAGPTAPEEQQMKGVHIYMGGIGLQQLFICVFVALAAKFYAEMNALERAGIVKEGWRRLLWTLFGSLGFITVRYLNTPPPPPFSLFPLLFCDAKLIQHPDTHHFPSSRVLSRQDVQQSVAVSRGLFLCAGGSADVPRDLVL